MSDNDRITIWSPHRRPRRVAISAIVLHDTYGKSAESSARWFENTTSGVSAHFVIERNGLVYQCVPLDQVAYHAGKSVLHGIGEVNEFSIGVELANDGKEPYPEEQIDKLVTLVASLCQEYVIPLNKVVGHDQVATPPGRKRDPGADFPWYEFLLAVGAVVSRSEIGEE